ncbi:MAG TPA: phytanoyl-CoA dioxygenase family protein [Porticoccaceae bacterium]
MQTIDNTAEYPCRLVTDSEVAHYREHGWTKLPQFVSHDLVDHLLSIAKGKMGEDADSNTAYGLSQPYFNAEYGSGLSDPRVRSLIEAIGKSARILLGRAPGVEAKYFTDFFAPKLPSGKVTKNAGNGPTAFHQDFITFAVDRSGGMTFWIALEDYGPEFGTMSFINGSHRLGVMGSYHTYNDAREAFPELNQLEMSEPLTYAVGDVSVHSHLTIHGAGPNLTDRPRWSYLVLAQPSDVCWNGAPPEAFDTTGMEVNQRLDDERFPIIGR